MVVEREFISCETRGTDVSLSLGSVFHRLIFQSSFQIVSKAKKKKSNSMFFLQSALFHVLNFHFPSVCWHALRFSASPPSLRMLTAEGKIKFIFLDLFFKKKNEGRRRRTKQNAANLKDQIALRTNTTIHLSLNVITK